MKYIDPDDVMLSPEYAKKLREGTEERDPLDPYLDRPLTKEELEEFGKHRRKPKTVPTIRPVFKIQDMGRKDKKPFIIPFVGIQVDF